ncbi:MAG: NAD-dependent malic enzyme [Verrucomicrobia bacterium]|nr:MAG: NAD-dependent malic enzyme [Verrucomicrobiota bacterium]
MKNPPIPATNPDRGLAVLRDAARNKDAAFTRAEREALGLQGLLPPAVQTLAQQVDAELEHLALKSEPIEKYIGLMALHDRNQTLFYRVLVDNLEALIPIIYTPVVGQACQRFSHIFRRPRGFYLCPDDVGRMVSVLRNWQQHDVRLIVVTDNERILGLGDQGAGGMGIPVGKLALYTAAAGIHPSLCLPISLDVGTDNGSLLEDPFYIGYRQRRLRGPAYDRFVEEFVAAVKTVFPRALLQWEDFKKANAFRLLDRYADALPSFNDDIQGTAAVALAGVLAGARLLGQSIAQQRVLLLGAGGAGVGIARLIRRAMRAEGMPEPEVRLRQVLFDSVGIVREGTEGLDAHKAEFALGAGELARLGLEDAASKTLEQVVEAFRPTVLIGTTAQPGIFSEAVIRAMGAHCERPMIFPLSNPTSQAECTASEALVHTGGRALVGTGSPFAPVEIDGKRHVIGQSNNVFIFPGVGLGALVAEAGRVTEPMFLAAAHALAEFTVPRDGDEGVLYPRIKDLRAISRKIALRVAQVAREEGIGRSVDDATLEVDIAGFVWEPAYPVAATSK